MTKMVSVILPVYNAQKDLARCLDSILGQDYENLEILAVNDGSTDDSLATLERYARWDERLKVFSQPNSGVSAARNLALEKAQGEYIRFVDADDALPPGSIRLMAEAMEKNQADLAIAPYTEVLAGSFRKVHGELKCQGKLQQRDFLDFYRQYPNSFYYSVLWNKLYSRRILQENALTFEQGMAWSEDFVFNTHYYRYIARVVVTEEPVYDYHRNVEGLTMSFTRKVLRHPIQSIRDKAALYRHYKALFVHTGLYKRNRLSVLLSFLKPTLGD